MTIAKTIVAVTTPHPLGILSEQYHQVAKLKKGVREIILSFLARPFSFDYHQLTLTP